jgi:hypothetical protein
MAQGTIFVGWGAIIAGREKVASKVLGEAMSYLEGLKAEGTIDSVDAVLLEPHGGELEGFVLVKGDKAKLAELRVQESFTKVIVAVQLVHSKVGVIGGYSGAEMQSLLQIWDQQEDELL